MARIRHVAITAEDIRKTADFYRDTLGLEEVGTHPLGPVFLSDGHVSLVIIPPKKDDDPDVGNGGPGYLGVHHVGFKVEDLEEASEALTGAGAQMVDDGSRYKTDAGLFEMKWQDPDGVVFDISSTGWLGAS
jgi:catechol 2,3-dioxygenase-like lactoylglutathione lyase family enzyme